MALDERRAHTPPSSLRVEHVFRGGRASIAQPKGLCRGKKVWLKGKCNNNKPIFVCFSLVAYSYVHLLTI